MNILISILGLGFLILIHEAGHFFVARWVGMNPRKFYVGFPPALVKKTRNGIEYGIGTIPLGGYVKIPGMHRPAAGDLDLHFGRAVDERPSLRRPVDELRGRLDESDYDGARSALEDVRAAVAQPPELSPVAQKTTDRGLTEIGDALAPDAYWRARTWKRVAVIFAGPGANLVLAVVLFALLFLSGGGKATSTVAEVVPSSPAAAIGLRQGDEIVAIGGTPVQADEIARRISGSGGDPITVTVQRDGAERRLGPVEPAQIDGAYRLGFVLEGEGLGPVESTWQAIRVTGIVTKEIGATIGRLVTGEGREEISSPVGIVQGSSEAVERGIENYLWVLGLISLSLALLNLLPLLPLDGGHIMFSLVEGIRRKAVAREVYERVSVVGIAVVLLLFFIGLSNDIGRLGN
jgi:regulator of sigma E protease